MWHKLSDKTPKIGYWVESRHRPTGSGGFTFVKDEPYIWNNLGSEDVMWRYNVPGLHCKQPAPIEDLDLESTLRSLLLTLKEVIEHTYEPAIESMLGGDWQKLKKAYNYANQIGEPSKTVSADL